MPILKPELNCSETSKVMICLKKHSILAYLDIEEKMPDKVQIGHSWESFVKSHIGLLLNFF